ncbi:hypothetical protein DWB68_01720 [Galactobacter valiniphilus]|uniref:Uncharacterized protein n=1 Tax=Galactobacter valiniphilus TaxID=2676122 RepID=A0A399JM36_9MICC|nr:hypothetical protein [Galactobacter valiniphilus]RII43636.1 hypothetical protein DWB68_01720 [Galactobacter valiniphilus]
MDLEVLIGRLETTREAVRRAALHAHELRPPSWKGPAAEAFERRRQQAQERCSGTLAALGSALREAQRLRVAMSLAEAAGSAAGGAGGGAGSAGRW